jgi:hypothetical protein
MLRKIFLTVLLLGFVALSGFFFYKFNQEKPVSRDYFAPIPTQSIWVMDVKEPSQLLATLKGTNIIYDEVKQQGLLNWWIPFIEKVDSLYNLSKPNTNEGLEINSIQLALVSSGANSADVLISLANKNLEETQIVEFAQQVIGTVKGKPNDYDGARIYEFSTGGYCSLYKGFVLFSQSKMVVEDAIRQLNADMGLMENGEFKRAVETAGTSRKLNWYVHQQALFKYLRTYFPAKFPVVGTLGGWMELDLWLKPTSFMFNGYSVPESNTDHFLSVLNNQSAASSKLSEILPLNTSFYASFNLSNFELFAKNYRHYLTKSDQISTYQKGLKKASDDAGIPIGSFLKNQVGTEVALAMLELPGKIDQNHNQTIQEKTVALIRVKDKEQWMQEILPAIKSNESDNLFDAEYRGCQIYQLKTNTLLSNALPAWFSMVGSQYMALIESYAVFGENQGIIREIINAASGNKNLANDDHYEAFADNLDESANLTLYSGIGRSPYLFEALANRTYSNFWMTQVEFLRQFQGGVVQITAEENRYYYNVFFKHNPIYKKVTSSLWELNLDTGIIRGPELFVNHYNKSGEILIQDESNTLHLVSNTGRLLWSKKLDGPVVSRFFKVDKFKNKKYQILCNTSSSVYLLDRNGKDVSGYPIKSKSTLGKLSLMDYDNTRKYRLLLPTEEGKILCYDINGKVVKGWKHKKSAGVFGEIQYVNVKNKDYLITRLQNNSVIALNRKGEVRLTFSEQFKLSNASSMTVLPSKTLSKSYLIGMDSAGNVLKLSMTNRLEIIQLKTGLQNLIFSMADVNRDKSLDFVFNTEEGIDVYSQKSEPILHLDLDVKLDFKPAFFTTNVATYCTYTNQTSNEVIMVNQFGAPTDGSPFIGSFKPKLSDINLDGRLELITATREGSVYCYTLNE